MRGDNTGPDERAVRAALCSILASEDFDGSERCRRFLAYVVEETLAGRGERIKAYSIGTTVFGRAADFDPQNDPIVRIEARRLRRSLERYYLTSGADDPVRISIPKGGYVPVFEHGGLPPSTRPGPVAQDRGSPLTGPAILVAAFEAEGDAAETLTLARGFTRDAIVALTRFTGLRVYGPEVMGGPGMPEAGAPEGPEVEVDYVLGGSVTLEADRLWIGATFMEARGGRYLWAESFERSRSPLQVRRLRDEVANTVARLLAPPHGVIFGHRAREVEGKPAETMSSYEAVVQFYRFWRHFRHERVEAVREALEDVIRREPEFDEAHACLSLLHSGIRRFTHGRVEAHRENVRLARELAFRAIELAPEASRSHHALGMACWFEGDVAGSLGALETGLSLNPNDNMILGDLGLRHAFLADWERAVPLLRESFEANPAQPGTYRIGLALHALVEGRHEDALAEARRMDAPTVVYRDMCVAIAAAHLGRCEEASAAVARILAAHPDFGAEIAGDLLARNVDPDLVSRIVEGLRLAGLAIGPRPRAAKGGTAG